MSATPPTPRPLAPGPPWLAPARTRRLMDGPWWVVAAALWGAGLMGFGWRGAAPVLVCGVVAAGVYAAVRAAIRRARPGWEGESAHHTLAMGVIAGSALAAPAGWSLAVLTGAILGLLTAVIGRTRRVRGHPVAGALAAVWVLGLAGGGAGWPGTPEPRGPVLAPSRLAVGQANEAAETLGGRWVAPPGADAVIGTRLWWWLPAHRGELMREPGRVGAAVVDRELPALERLLVGLVPGPGGAGAAGVILALGLYLVYRQAAWWRVMAGGWAGAVAALLLMPVWKGGGWTVAGAALWAIGPAAGYALLWLMLLGSPLPVAVMLLGPQGAPTNRRGRWVYGLGLGVLGAAGWWWLKAPEAVWLAVVVMGALARPLDAVGQSPFARRGGLAAARQAAAERSA